MSIKERASGILMHVSSLPSEYGIGKLGKSARQFVDFLKRSGTKYWQILPLSQTSYGDSPYQSFSIHAGNPYFIDFETLEAEGVLHRKDYSDIEWGVNPRIVDYSAIYKNCSGVLRKAYSNARAKRNAEYRRFTEENAFWLDEYSLFMALKGENEGEPWYKWEPELAAHKAEAVEEARERLRNEIEFFKYTQFWFFRQWKSLKDYANKNGVEIIGDIPIYVAYDSVEVWSQPKLFYLDLKKRPIAVAGCPPDAFSETGQLWGNPLYDWAYMKKTGYKWWKERISAAKEFYDVLRIDHFRGFESYYSIPYGNPTAEKGEWKKGPGYSFFESLSDVIGDYNIIAEDLGFITDEVREMLDKTGYPGMKVLQFGFGGDSASEYLPHNFRTTNTIAYTGTHDNDTIGGWISTADAETLKYVKKYFRVRALSEVPESVIRAAWGSIAVLAVAQIQDFLTGGAARRMNTPSTLGGNWDFRTLSTDFNLRLVRHIRDLNETFNRLTVTEDEAEKKIRLRDRLSEE